MKKILKRTGYILLTLILVVILFAKTEYISKISLGMHDEINVDNFDNKALKGLDAVSFHTSEKPVAIKKDFKLEWKGAEWLFNTE